jgi:prevent-host-death family protein
VYARVVAKFVPVREFRARLSELLDDVADRRDHVLVTRNGKPTAALVPIDEWSGPRPSDTVGLALLAVGLVVVGEGDGLELGR